MTDSGSVFGRNSKPHPYDAAIDEWLHSAEPEERAMARNLMHDHRISKAREQEFDRLVDRPCNTVNLQRAIKKYFEKKVRTRTLPDYVYKRVNANNLLTGKDEILPYIHKDVKLVRVLDLNGLRRVFQWAKSKRRWGESFEKFPRRPNDATIAKWLDEKLQGSIENQIERFVGTVLDVMNDYRREHPYQPTWATTWTAFEPYLEDEPDRWLQVLGMAKVPPRWLILLKYTVREAGTIARPTQLDAGWYAYHFPSPPQAPLGVGGHPMDLRISRKLRCLLPEYIHKQISHPLEHWKDVGSRIGRATAPNLEALAEQRKVHHELLTTRYGKEVCNWMPSPISHIMIKKTRR